MESSIPRRYSMRAEMFKALAHPARVYILDKLRERPRCVCELAAEIGIGKSAASKHLTLLKAAGLVNDERRGTLVEYRLVAPCVLEMAACAEGTILENRRKLLELPEEG